MKHKLWLSLLIIITFALLLIGIDKSKADVYVKVDAAGNAIGGAIVCDAGTCGDPNSLYSKLTLGEGERYVLQGYGTTGIGNNNPDTQVKVDIETNTWTVTTPTNTTTFVPQPEPTPTVTPHVTIVETPTVVESSTVITDTRTVTINDTSTTTTTTNNLYEQVLILLAQLFALLAKLGI